MNDSDTAKTSQASAGARTLKPRKMPPIEQLRGRQLGRILIKMGKLRRAQVHEALEIQKEQRGPVGAILVELGYISDEDLSYALAAQNGMEFVDLGKLDIAQEVTSLMSVQMAGTYRVVPYQFDEAQGMLSIAMDSPDNFVAADD